MNKHASITEVDVMIICLIYPPVSAKEEIGIASGENNVRWNKKKKIEKRRKSREGGRKKFTNIIFYKYV